MAEIYQSTDISPNNPDVSGYELHKYDKTGAKHVYVKDASGDVSPTSHESVVHDFGHLTRQEFKDQFGDFSQASKDQYQGNYAQEQHNVPEVQATTIETDADRVIIEGSKKASAKNVLKTLRARGKEIAAAVGIGAGEVSGIADLLRDQKLEEARNQINSNPALKEAIEQAIEADDEKGNTKVAPSAEATGEKPKTGPAIFKPRGESGPAIRVIIEGYADGLENGVDVQSGKKVYKGRREGDNRPYDRLYENKLTFLDETEGATGVNGTVNSKENLGDFPRKATYKGKAFSVTGYSDKYPMGRNPEDGKIYYKGHYRSENGEPVQDVAFTAVPEDALAFEGGEPADQGPSPDKDKNKEERTLEDLVKKFAGKDYDPSKPVEFRVLENYDNNGGVPTIIKGKMGEGWKVSRNGGSTELDITDESLINLLSHAKAYEAKAKQTSKEEYEQKAKSPATILELQKEADKRFDELKEAWRQRTGTEEEPGEQLEEYFDHLSDEDVIDEYFRKNPPVEGVDVKELRAYMLDQMAREPEDLEAEQAEDNKEEATPEEELKSRLDEIALLLSIGNIEEAKKKIDELRSSIGSKTDSGTSKEAEEPAEKSKKGWWARVRSFVRHPIHASAAYFNSVLAAEEAAEASSGGGTPEKKKRRRRAVLVGAVVVGGAVAVAYLGSRHGIPVPRPPHVVPPVEVNPHTHGLVDVDWSSFHPQTFGGHNLDGTPMNAHQSVKDMFDVFRNNGYHVSGLNDERVNQVLSAMKEQHMHVAFGIDASGNQHIVDAAQGYAHGGTANEFASNYQGLERVGGSSVENWHRFANIAARYGISIKKS